MKQIYDRFAWCIMAGLLSLTGCSDEDNGWTPGERADVAFQVYFTTGDPETTEIDLQHEKVYTLALSRDDVSDAVSVPVLLEGSPEFEVSATAEFAAGEGETTVDVTFRGTDTPGVYSCTVSIPEGAYNSPYTSRTTKTGITLRVPDWQLYASNVKISDYGSAIFNEPYYVSLYQDGDRYRLEGFMSNYNLVSPWVRRCLICHRTITSIRRAAPMAPTTTDMMPGSSTRNRVGKVSRSTMTCCPRGIIWTMAFSTLMRTATTIRSSVSRNGMDICMVTSTSMTVTETMSAMVILT